jgi:small redox-active disulfide protein 2
LVDEEETMKIEILGTGCPKCEAVAKNALAAVAQLGIQAEVVKVTDITEIAARGVMLTPALAIDGEIRVVGKVPTIEEIEALIQGNT